MENRFCFNESSGDNDVSELLDSVPTVSSMIGRAAARILAVFSKNLRSRDAETLQDLTTHVGNNSKVTYLNVELFEDPGSMSLCSITIDISYELFRGAWKVTDNAGNTYLIINKATVTVNWPSIGAVAPDRAKSIMGMWSLAAEVASNIDWELNSVPSVKELISTREENEARERARKEALAQRAVNDAVKANSHRMRVGSEKVIDVPVEVAASKYVTQIDEKVFETSVVQGKGRLTRVK